MTEVTFSFDGNPVRAEAGHSLAAALTAAGYRAFRRSHRDSARGLFCGMGVCQDCLLTVDKTPNRRACMTKVADGMRVETQVPFPALDPKAARPEVPEARRLAPDVLVIGGGAGGLSAAIAARRAGAEVVLVDERRVAGGQYFKQAAAAAPLDAQQSEGAALLAEAEASGAEILGGVEIWGAFDGPVFLARCDGGALILRPKTVVVATGAYERPAIVPGWTLPGVMTTGAAQTLWRSYRTLPGKRVIVAGSGPLNMQVALELAEGGAEVAMVAEAAASPLRHPWRGAQLFTRGPALAWKGLAMLRGLKRHGVPVRNETRLAAIEADGDGLLAHFRRSDGAAFAERADVICTNVGFEPQNEILRLLGADMLYEPTMGHLRCVRSAGLETTVPGLFAVGDCAGLGGAPAATAEGRIAGRVAAARAGYGDAYDLFADQRALRWHRRFQETLWHLHDIAPVAIANLPGDTLLCRCEEITVAEALDGYAANPGHIGTLKRGTRLGMGRCQGRYCGPAAARLIAGMRGESLTDRSFFAPRVPIKPVAINAILAAEEALGGDD
ncbi:2Fe-2S iron-sulfur cluster-binding protein [Ovoidimarina sediminis]|uniref:2Fe-2S iron-sulfur cluster-binding protein n=1 Tax=Ovoidimarina sediminis TaxID=3079856 RepID=UPI00290ECBD7|nr:2Fe-2S iron-sulfur cluster-binding protein [Rhodophyticola sp. MJ-SS7]MDU8944226.1 FAD-dependent oxidoreductase [Rhodophyticola sp. MJ-SS7]